MKLALSSKTGENVQKLIDRLFRKPDPSSDWVIVRMRAVTQQIGPRYKSGLFTQYTEASNG